MSGSSLATAIHRISGSSQQSSDDLVAVEEPLEIRLGFEKSGSREDSSVSITMRTPGSDAELATGFLYTEAIIRSAADIALVKHCGTPAPDTGSPNVIRVELEPGVDVDLERLQRHFYTTSSCGVCGKTSLDALRTCGAAHQSLTTTRFSKAVLTALPDRLRAAQKTFAVTGGLHAAAAFDTAGNLVACHEDIGRHNAVDKVIGELLSLEMLPATDLGLIVSGRASFELLQKAVMAGMPILAAVSAPSSLAVDLAREFNVTLVGFLRGDTFNIYSAEERIV
jgi:FdhD protein